MHLDVPKQVCLSSAYFDKIVIDSTLCMKSPLRSWSSDTRCSVPHNTAVGECFPGAAGIPPNLAFVGWPIPIKSRVPW